MRGYVKNVKNWHVVDKDKDKETMDNVYVKLSFTDSGVSLGCPLKVFLRIWEQKVVQFKEMTIEEFKIQLAVGSITALGFIRNASPYGNEDILIKTYTDMGYPPIM